MSDHEAAWERVLAAVRTAKPVVVADVVRGLDAEARKAVGRRTKELLRLLPAAGRPRLSALRVAGTGCLSGAAAAAAWTARRDLRDWRHQPTLTDALVRVVADRPREWRLDYARRLVGRLRVAELLAWGADRVMWEVPAALLREAGEPPPRTPEFAGGWLVWRPDEPVADDPLFPGVLETLFDADGLGPILAVQAPFDAPAREGGVPLAEQIVANARRVDLLDGCVRRFLRGGDGSRIAWYVALHRRLAPTPEESAARLRDYVRLLPNAALPVAELAFEQVKAVHALTPLAPETYAEAASALLFRPERKLLKAALIWLGKTAKGREGVVVAQAAAAFAIEHADTRDRAVRLAVRHAKAVDPLAAETVREAAAVLPGPLREAIAAAYGGAAEPEEAAEPPVLYPVAPRELDPPIASPAELLETVLAELRSPRAQRWADGERLLAGLVTHGPAIAGDLRALNERHPWLLHADASGLMGVHFVLNSLARGRPQRGVIDYLRDRLGKAETLPGRPHLTRFLHRRFLDATARFGAPTLLATPTSSTGHVDPEVFAARLRMLEEAGLEPGAYDLEQALLRLPREAAASVLDGLVSPAAKTARSWIEGGGLPDPEIAYEVVGYRRSRRGFWDAEPKTTHGKRLHAVATGAEGTGSAAFLTRLDTATIDDAATHRVARWWTSVMPAHRELTAVHLLRQAEWWPLERYEQGEILLDLADATGPTGPATAALLVYGLSSPHTADRAGALDALLSFAAQDAVPTASMGSLIPILTGSGDITLSRVTGCLADAVRAGANLWPLFETAIPALLPAPSDPTPAALADLLAAASTNATLHHIRTPIPALQTWTPRSNTSRAAKEATHLTTLLTP
ncbi:DUF6493 family protein [Actinocorallia sp. A-T 12471]|uniref:DUF6493 family protein n=1 Tax=Actinocorallia sp. A-T 12471 TaxID=3089813 RepID=UPI0029CB91F4|nr:DUF6493 family protein [Actinocorallia sp. A-T 12471]MDX6742224.1 DUF6493 family protein [Actinocorallia sp. A-T 12471]